MSGGFPSEGEYALARGFDRIHARNTAHAQALVDRKNDQLDAAHAEITRLREALRIETGKRRHAELQLAQSRRH